MKKYRSTIFTYLLFSLFALVATAGHFTTPTSTAADAFKTTPVGVEFTSVSSLEPTTPDIATYFTSSTPISTPIFGSSSSVFTISNAVQLPANARTIDVIAANDTSVYHYRSLYFGHASYDFGNIKNLSVGDTINAEGNLYTVAFIRTYTFSELEDNPSLRSQIYNYNGITLMTCGTAGNVSTAYRTVVFAK